MEIQLKYDGNTMEIQLKYDGNTMETQWKYNRNTIDNGNEQSYNKHKKSDIND